ncbi:MAG: hypothetical protein RJA19_1727, partial [Bacteroidota bacterium]
LPILVVADGLQDPGNLGTLIRSADWFGARGVWVSENSVDPWNPKTIQAAMGWLFDSRCIRLRWRNACNAIPSFHGWCWMQGVSL